MSELTESTKLPVFFDTDVKERITAAAKPSMERLQITDPGHQAAFELGFMAFDLAEALNLLVRCLNYTDCDILQESGNRLISKFLPPAEVAGPSGRAGEADPRAADPSGKEGA